jgi:ABC-type nitrate/sulfonate/bicarbonate transport system permease component
MSLRARGRTRGAIRRLLSSLSGLLPIAAIILLWEVVARWGGVPPLLLPPFSAVVEQLVTLTVSGQLLTDLYTTSMRAAVGLLIGMVAGIACGLAMARVRAVKWFLDPLVAIGFPTPTIALLPVVILWFGTGHGSKIFLVALTCFFPIVMSTYAGAREVPSRFLWSAQAMGTSAPRLLTRVIFPAAAPFVFSGIRVAVPLAVIVCFVAEMVGGGGGLGYALIFGYRFMQTTTVFSALVVILLFGLVLDRALLFLRRKLLPWDESE